MWISLNNITEEYMYGIFHLLLQVIPMAGSMVRFKWWLQNQLRIHRQDIVIILVLLSCLFIVLYALISHYDDPDATDISISSDIDERVIKQALKDAQNEKPWMLDADLMNIDMDREREKAKFERVQEKLKHLDKKKKKKPGKKKTDSHTNTEEDDMKFALKDEDDEDIVKDKEYWLKKYRHIFHGGFELGFDIQAPVDAGLKGGKTHCTIYDHRAPVNESYECIELQVKKKPLICLYPTSSDVHLSKFLRLEGTWEPHIVKLFIDYLNTDPSLGFIDIGANIGVYTLTAATLGHRVVAIEPYEENLKHLSQGVQLSKLEDNVIVLQNAISDKRLNYVDLNLDPTNQGGIHINESNHNFKCYGDDCPPQTKTIYLDDVLDVMNFKSAIIKIDIEGHEHRAFRQSKELFDRIYVPCIIMEWIKLKGYYGTEVDESEDKTMVHELVAYLTDQGYQAFSMVTGQKLTPGYWYAWPDDVIWKHMLVGVV